MKILGLVAAAVLYCLVFISIFPVKLLVLTNFIIAWYFTCMLVYVVVSNKSVPFSWKEFYLTVTLLSPALALGLIFNILAMVPITLVILYFLVKHSKGAV